MAWLSGYTTRRKITIDNTKIDATLTDFPVLVSLTDANFDFAKANSDGFDLRFTAADGTTLLKYEREIHDSVNKVATYWVKVPSVASDADTYIYVYYRTTDTADGADPENVWDSNFVMVQHLKDNTTSATLDSTSNNNDGTKKGANEPIEATGKIYKAQDFDGSNDYINYGNVGFTATDLITIEAWVKTSGVVDKNIWIVNKGYTSHANPYYEYALLIRRTNDGGGNAAVYIVIDGTVRTVKDANAWADNAWHYIYAVYDGSSLKVGGDLEAPASVDYSGDLSNYETNAMIGAPTNSAAEGYFDGLIDEVRLSKTNRSAAWIKASYNSGAGSLLSVGSEISTQVKSINGLAIASIKSKNGLAIDSIKSINGL